MEQTVVKKQSWGCADQLLINIMVIDQPKQQWKNLFLIWFELKQAINSVPHSCIRKTLQLAKVPEKVINAVLRFMELWVT